MKHVRQTILALTLIGSFSPTYTTAVCGDYRREHLAMDPVRGAPKGGVSAPAVDKCPPVNYQRVRSSLPPIDIVEIMPLPPDMAMLRDRTPSA